MRGGEWSLANRATLFRDSINLSFVFPLFLNSKQNPFTNATTHNPRLSTDSSSSNSSPGYNNFAKAPKNIRRSPRTPYASLACVSAQKSSPLSGYRAASLNPGMYREGRPACFACFLPFFSMSFHHAHLHSRGGNSLKTSKKSEYPLGNTPMVIPID